MGVGLLDNDTIVVWVLAPAVGLLSTPHRTLWRSRLGRGGRVRMAGSGRPGQDGRRPPAGLITYLSACFGQRASKTFITKARLVPAVESTVVRAYATSPPRSLPT